MIKIKTTIAFVFFIATMTLYAQKPDYYTQGIEQAQRENYEGAIATFQQGLAENPKDGHYYYGLAYCYSSLGQFGQALTFLEKAVKNLPKSEKWLAHKERAFIFYNLGNIDAAMKSFADGIKSNPTDYHCYRTRADMCKEIGQYTQAKKDYLKVIELDPTVTWAYNCLAEMTYDPEEPDEALGYLNAAIKHNRKAEVSYYYRAEIYRQLGKYDESTDDIVSLLMLNNSDDVISEMLSISDSAETLLIEKLQAQQYKYPSESFWTRLCGLVSSYHCHFHAAAKYYEKILKTEPEEYVYSLIMNAYFQANDYAKSLQVLDELCATFPDSADQYIEVRYLLYHANGQGEKTLQLLREKLEENPADTSLLDNLSYYAYENRDWLNAIQYVEQKIGLMPETPQKAFSYNLLGKCKLQKGDVEGARSCFEKSITLRDDMITPYYFLGDKASALVQALKSYPNDMDSPDSLFHASDIYAQIGEVDLAMKYLRKACENGVYFGQAYVLKVSPRYDNLRELPEFKALIEEYDRKCEE